VTEIAILGCGPAGLLAAHATVLAGHTPRILSIKHRGVMPGAMYLHRPIKDLTEKKHQDMIRLSKIGTQEGYAQKVYGRRDAPVSWSIWNKGHYPIWNLRAAYEELWARYESYIKDVTVTANMVYQVRAYFPLVISTIPAKTLCLRPREHSFTERQIWVIHDAPSLDKSPQSNIMIYNGLEKTPWYRFASIFGFRSYEYGHNPVEQLGEDLKHLPIATGIKPLGNTCTCHSKRVKSYGDFVKVGRYGRWEKNVLTHHAFKQAKEAVNAL
jgi:hypothetical protein